MNIFKQGDSVYLAHDIIDPASGDHPAFLLGRKGEKVVIVRVYKNKTAYPYEIEGETNSGSTWFASSKDLMHTKPFK